MPSIQTGSLPLPLTIKARASDEVHKQWLEDLGVHSFQGRKLLDLGCGSGYLANLAKLQGAKASVGIDIEEPAEGLPAAGGWQFVQANLDKDDWISGMSERNFDIILAFDIIEHLRSPVAFLEQCHALLSPGGSLYLTTPNVQSLERFFKPEHWSGAFDPQHRVLFSRYSLHFLLRRMRFEAVQLNAPMRSLRFLPRWLQPAIGGQILVQAKIKAN